MSAIPAATILLLRDAPALEVLMIERHAETPFAGGAIVFPGGRIDPGDALPEWRDHCDGFEEAPAEQRAPRIAAIREAFEEAGVLIARHAGQFVTNEESAALNEWRAKVEADDALFLELIKAKGLRLALDALQLFARWEPPDHGHGSFRRYHTWFFAALTPPGQEAREDGNEATEVFWTAPRQALEDVRAGKRKMIFPTMRNVELLGVSECAEGVLTHCAERKQVLVQPEIVKRDDGVFLTIPDGLGYPILEEDIKTAMRG